VIVVDLLTDRLLVAGRGAIGDIKPATEHAWANLLLQALA